jgi:hypothetical protein
VFDKGSGFFLLSSLALSQRDALKLPPEIVKFGADVGTSRGRRWRSARLAHAPISRPLSAIDQLQKPLLPAARD